MNGVPPRPKKQRRSRSRNPRFRTFFQSLCVIAGHFDGEELVTQHHRYPATLAKRSTVSPGDRGEFVAYLKSVPDSEQVYYPHLELVRLRGQNDPHVAHLKDAGYVAGRVLYLDQHQTILEVCPDKRHEATSFRVQIAFYEKSPHRPPRPGKVACYRYEFNPRTGVPSFIGRYTPPIKTKPLAKVQTKESDEPGKPKPIKRCVVNSR